MRRIFTTICLFFLAINLYATSSQKKSEPDFVKPCSKASLDECNEVQGLDTFNKKSNNFFFNPKQFQSKSKEQTPQKIDN